MKRVYTGLLLLISLSCFGQKFTDLNGRLKVSGRQLINEQGKPIQLRGFNTYNLTYCPECVTREAVRSNSQFWGANVIRATMYVDDYWNDQSYILNPQYNKQMIDSLVQWTEEFGIYCIIEWHILKIGNPNAPEHAGADDFFREMSVKYADKTHVLYDICNEPNGKEVTWDTIADYANRIIPIIRENDSQSVILVGTPDYSQRLDQVKPEKIRLPENVMYTFHFYAASHLDLLSILEAEIHRIPVFASEWGVCEYTGNGDVNFENSKKFMDVMEQHVFNKDTVSVSWCSFSYSDVDEAASMLKPESCTQGKWENMTPTGYFFKDYLNPGKD